MRRKSILVWQVDAMQSAYQSQSLERKLYEEYILLKQITK